jgi:hypothetical protein
MYPSDRRILPLMVLATARERQQRSGFFFFIAEAYRQRVVPMARVLVLLTKSRKFWAPAPGAPRRARQVKKKKFGHRVRASRVRAYAPTRVLGRRIQRPTTRARRASRRSR